MVGRGVPATFCCSDWGTLLLLRWATLFELPRHDVAVELEDGAGGGQIACLKALAAINLVSKWRPAQQYGASWFTAAPFDEVLSFQTVLQYS